MSDGRRLVYQRTCFDVRIQRSALNRVEVQAMSNIVKFPRARKPSSNKEEKIAAPPTAPALKSTGRGLINGLVKFVWVTTVLVWPILRWVLSIITFFQFVLMIYYWDTPNVYAGWSFLAYFTLLTAITYFVSVYKPKGL